MGVVRNGMQATTVPVEKFIGTAFDTVKNVGDNLDVITQAAQLIGTFFPSATVPTTRQDGSPLQEGDRYFNTTNDITYVWNGTIWISVGINQTTVEVYVATEGQTSFTLNTPYTVNGNNLLTIVNATFQISKSMDATNGAYTESSATTVTFDTGLSAGDLVVFIIGTPITDSTTALTITKKEYTVQAADDKKVFTIPDGISYIVGSNNLKVAINGVEQYPSAYAETSITSITFTEDTQEGDELLFTITSIVD